ncbi:MAG TPA: EamA family transporter [Prevotella sp.]|nr:EamA family transporter [Prevotella sp.]
MNSKVKGTICGILAAISYGTNPLGALNLYADGLNANSVIFYRYALATLILAAIMVIQRKSFAVTRREFKVLLALGVLMAGSSLALYCSFNFMDAGIASTILFVYPVMVAVIMAVFFKEKVTPVTIVSIVLALSGISLLYKGGDGAVLSTVGVILVIISSLTYAVYIVVVNKSSLRMSSVKLTFYVLFIGTLMIILYSFTGDSARLQSITSVHSLFYALLLAVFPTVISLILMVIAVHNVGSTPTAVMGALEPITAVCIGVFVFGEVFTMRLAVGCLLILAAVTLIVAGKALPTQHITYVFSRLGRKVMKKWRWKG